MYLISRLATWLLLLSSLLFTIPGLTGPKECHRIVSLLPSATDCLFAIGAGSTVVGVTRFDSHKGIPTIGGIVDFSREKVMALRPDCIVGPKSLTSRISDIARIVQVDFSTLNSVYESIKLLGQVTHHSKKALNLISTIKTGLYRLHHLSTNMSRPRVLFVISLHPLYVAGSSGFIGQLINLVGGQNIAKKGRFPQWSLEDVIAYAPQVVILFKDKCQDVPSKILKWPVPAIKQGRVFVVCDPNLVRPGPGLVEAALTLYTVIHGPVAF